MIKKKVLIIGGSSDIGFQLAKIYLQRKTYNLDLHYNSNLKNIKIFKNKCNFIKADLSKNDYKKIIKKFSNNYDIIINLVGYISERSFEKSNLQTLEKTLRINSHIPMLIIKKSLKKMIKNKWGRIVNSSSIGVKFGGGKLTYEYSLAKHVNEFIPSFVRNLAHKNIFFNTIKIGLTDTKIHKKISNRNIVKRTKLVPVKRMASAKNIAHYIYYISSDQNEFITNEIINITGGE